MNDFKKMQEAIIKAIDTIVNDKLKKIKYNYYVDGIIQNKSHTGNSYDVLIANETYKNIPSKHKLKYNVGDVVQILVKNGDWNKKFIDGAVNSNIIDTIYPVGSILMQTRENSINPEVSLGGTWNRIDESTIPNNANIVFWKRIN